MVRTSRTEIPRDKRKRRRQHHRKEDDDAAAIADADRLSMEDCPPELIFEILKRSSVRSLLRLRSVCKQWNHTITSLDFIRNHYHHNSDKSRLLVYWRGSSEQSKRDWVVSELDIRGLSLFRDETLEQYDQLDHSLLAEGPLEIHTMLGPCNGVFFVADYHNDRLRLFLWNISTRKFRQLPCPQHFGASDQFGFGMDPLTDEFKIVLIHFASSHSIYTSRQDSWRYFENGPLLEDYRLQTFQCGTTFSQRCFHWRKRDNETFTSVILAFDMCSEVFKEIELPSEIREKLFVENMLGDYGAVMIARTEFVPTHQALLHVFEDTLALICFEFDIDSHEGKMVDLWLMKEQGSWTKLACLPLDFKCFRPLGFYAGKSIIFSLLDEADNEELVTHDPDTGNTRIVSFPAGEDVGCRDLHVYNYKESLFSV